MKNTLLLLAMLTVTCSAFAFGNNPVPQQGQWPPQGNQAGNPGSPQNPNQGQWPPPQGNQGQWPPQGRQGQWPPQAGSGQNPPMGPCVYDQNQQMPAGYY